MILIIIQSILSINYAADPNDHATQTTSEGFNDVTCIVFLNNPNMYNTSIRSGTWTIRTLDNSDLVNSDLMLFSFGQFGPQKIRPELTKSQMFFALNCPKAKWISGPN